MGVRIIVADKEPIALALKRFKRSLERHGVNWELAKMVGEQATDSPSSELKTAFWERTGKP